MFLLVKRVSISFFVINATDDDDVNDDYDDDDGDKDDNVDLFLQVVWSDIAISMKYIRTRSTTAHVMK